MFRRIMVPLDGSTTAERALPMAARLARAAGGTLVFVKVVNLAPGYAPFPAGAPDVAPMDWYQLQDRAESYLEAIASRAELSDIASESHVLSGPIASSIIDAVADYGADLLVLTSHGRTGLARWVLGSVAQKLSRHSPVPVFVLRDEVAVPAHGAANTASPIEVLVALDGSPLAETALQPADELLTALCSASPGVLHLLRIAQIPHQPVSVEKYELREELDALAQETVLREAQDYLSKVADRLRALPTFDRNLSITTSVIFDPDIARGILGAAGERQPGQIPNGTPVATAIVMATHGRGGLDRWAMGSITERVLHETALPLLIVSPSARVPSSPFPAHAERQDESSRWTTPLF